MSVELQFNLKNLKPFHFSVFFFNGSSFKTMEKTIAKLWLKLEIHYMSKPLKMSCVHELTTIHHSNGRRYTHMQPS